MKEVLIVILSAIVGYIVLSAFSVSSSPQEAMRRIIEQPHNDIQTQKELDLTRLEKEQEEKLAQLQMQKDIEALHVKQNIEITKDKYNTDVKLKEIDFKKDKTLAGIKYSSVEKQKAQDNKMLIAISILIFILIYIYLKYQKNLAQIEIEKDKEYKSMLAKKEYAEKILSIVASGNISIETEHKLLKILDEINNPQVERNGGTIIHHPNPDIEQLPFQKNI
jgi:DNA primase catalytic subunit